MRGGSNVDKQVQELKTEIERLRYNDIVTGQNVSALFVKERARLAGEGLEALQTRLKAYVDEQVRALQMEPSHSGDAMS